MRPWEQVRNYDLMSAVMICLGEEDNKNYGGLLRFLEMLLSEKKCPETKKEILEAKFEVPVTQTLEGEVRYMCNLSQGVAERAMEKGVAKGLQQGMAQGENRATLAAIRSLMKNANLTAYKAMEMLDVSPAEQAQYLKQLKY